MKKGELVTAELLMYAMELALAKVVEKGTKEIPPSVAIAMEGEGEIALGKAEVDQDMEKGQYFYSLGYTAGLKGEAYSVCYAGLASEAWQYSPKEKEEFCDFKSINPDDPDFDERCRGKVIESCVLHVMSSRSGDEDLFVVYDLERRDDGNIFVTNRRTSKDAKIFMSKFADAFRAGYLKAKAKLEGE